MRRIPGPTTERTGGAGNRRSRVSMRPVCPVRMSLLPLTGSPRPFSAAGGHPQSEWQPPRTFTKLAYPSKFARKSLPAPPGARPRPPIHHAPVGPKAPMVRASATSAAARRRSAATCKPVRMQNSGCCWRRKQKTAQGSPRTSCNSRNAAIGRPSGPNCHAGKRTPRLAPPIPRRSPRRRFWRTASR